jgi:hypothetical protein
LQPHHLLADSEYQCPSENFRNIVMLFVRQTISMKWSRDHVLTCGYRRDLLLTVDLDRIKVISSGSVVMKIDAKVCFPRWPSGSQSYLKSDQMKILNKCIHKYVQSFRSIAPAVTKRALLTDDAGRRVNSLAHQLSQKKQNLFNV